MEDVTNVCVTEYIPTIYTRKCTLNYTLNNKEKSCDLFAERPGVVIIIYNKTRNVLVLVKQFRPSSYFQQIPDEEVFDGEVDTNKYKPEIGVTLEFCAGLEDKNISTEEIAIEEIYEECGYDVKKDNLERITQICNLSTTTGARSTFYYCEVTDDMRVSEGGGVEGENVEVVEMKVGDVINYANQTCVPSPVCFLFGLHWFLFNKYNK